MTVGKDSSIKLWIVERREQRGREEEGQPGRKTEFGQRYTVDLTLRRGGREARIRSAWIVRAEENSPRLISCYVL